MQISVQQHNAVVVGLSTQLSIQKSITNEKNTTIANLIAENGDLRARIENLQRDVNSAQEQSNGLAQKLFACEVALENPGVQVSDESLRSNTLAGIQSLQERLSQKCCKGKRGCCKRG